MSLRIRVFAGTKRGLFSFTSDARREQWQSSEPFLRGREIYFVGAEPRDPGRIWATSNHKVWGPHIHLSTDGGETWELLHDAPHYPDERGLDAVWSIARLFGERDALFAGIEPAGLFTSRDAGRSWGPVNALNEHPTSSTWQPAGGALALHSICNSPARPERLFCAVSAGGAYRSDDDGSSWQPINRGVSADFLPNTMPESGQCVHRLLVHPRNPDRLWQQNHCGVYRSDDAGESWIDVSVGLPSPYGYALAIDAADPDAAFVIPEESSDMRTTIGGRLRVYRTRDAGHSWQPLTHGLPQHNAYVSILREGLASDLLDPCGLYFGTSSGHLFASSDAGDSWRTLAEFLPRIICVHAAFLDG